ncbi:MAG: glycosyltransferase family 2 protein [Bacteroidota bacterium]|nr:glycosyltransferase family 2 protein [Bacteroidota bacterium]
MASCTILILTYKGKHHLELLLPTVKAAIENYGGKTAIDVMIVDNGCDELTRDFVRAHYPDYNYLFSPVNDYLFSLNSFIKELPAEWLFMLNDDMKLEKDVLNELIPVMEKDQSLFAVTCRIMDFEGTYTASAVRALRYSRGWIYNYYLDAAESEPKYTLYPGGGAAIFRTAFFNALNGFDTLFRPAYAEDLDLGTRAWQRNWKTVYHPKAVLYHREGGTIGDQFKKNKLEQMIGRNHILWMIKNGRFPGFLFWFFLMLPYRMVYAFFKSRNQYQALKGAVQKLKPALQGRRASEIIAKDKIWSEQLNKPYP